MGKVNTNLWGTESEWVVNPDFNVSQIGEGSTEIRKEIATYRPNNKQQKGQTRLGGLWLNGKLNQENPMDYSTSFVGAENTFCATKGRYISWSTGNYYIEDLVVEPKGTYCPLMILQADNSTPNFYRWNLTGRTDMAKLQYSVEQQEISPNAKVNLDVTDYGQMLNPNMAIGMPCATIPFQNWVNLIVVRVCPSTPTDIVNNATIGNARVFTLEAYCNGLIDQQRAYEQYPTILGVGILTFTSRTNAVYDWITNQTGTSLSRYLQTSNTYIGVGNTIYKPFKYINSNKEDEIADATLYENVERYAACCSRNLTSVSSIITTIESTINSDVKTSQITNISNTSQGYIMYITGAESPLYFTSNYSSWVRSDYSDYIIGEKFNVVTDESNKNHFVYTTIDDYGGINGLYNYFVSQVAYLGMFYTPRLQTALQGKLNDDAMFLGEIDSNGYTHGSFAYGKDNEELSNYNWIEMISQSAYSPDAPTPLPADRNTYDENSNIRKQPVIATDGIFCANYALTYGEVKHLQNYLYTYLPDVSAEQRDNLFLTSNPIDCIVSIMAFPFPLDLVYGRLGGLQNLKLGNLTLSSQENVQGVLGYPLTYPTNTVLDLGSIQGLWDMNGGQFRTFLDFEPYTTATLYIPYCDPIKIDASEWINRKMTVKIIVDMTTGQCQALVLRDNLVMATSNGNIGASIAVSGLQTATLQNAMYDKKIQALKSNTGIFSSLTTTAIGLATGNVMQAVGGIIGTVNNTLDMKNADYQLHHHVVDYKQVGNSTPTNNMTNEQFCRLVIERPIYMENYNPTVYADTIGFACNIQSTLNSVSGFTICSNVDLSGINCTATEKQMILEKLQAGVFL